LDTTGVLIIGGGIGGLATAVALSRAGIEARLFERSPELHEVGAGLSLWSNAVAALDRLGLRDAVVAVGDPLERAVTTTDDGAVLTDVSIAEVASELGQPSICVHRADLQDLLAGALEPGSVRLGAECIGVELEGDGIIARFADGQYQRGAILIAADGIHSRVREQLWGQAPPRYAGYFAFRGIAHCDHPELPPGTSRFALGSGTQIGFTRCGAGRVYWFATLNAPEGTTIVPGARKRSALDRFRGWLPLVHEVIEATPEEALLVNDIVDRPPRRVWGTGPITLLGDAAHPTTPNLGQGGCLALEDAVVLASALRSHGLGTKALRAYERARRARTASIQRQSWWLGKVFQLESPIAIRMRNRLIRSPIGQRQATAGLRAILSCDLPELSVPSATRCPTARAARR
jgi:2-polyprenyl-6-methoxyphenol hydroxylase-like FAD-dependent oxidoreductase